MFVAKVKSKTITQILNNAGLMPLKVQEADIAGFERILMAAAKSEADKNFVREEVGKLRARRAKLLAIADEE